MEIIFQLIRFKSKSKTLTKNRTASNNSLYLAYVINSSIIKLFLVISRDLVAFCYFYWGFICLFLFFKTTQSCCCCYHHHYYRHPHHHYHYCCYYYHYYFIVNNSDKNSGSAALEFLHRRDLQSSTQCTTSFCRIEWALILIINDFSETVHAKTLNISMSHVFIETF